MMSQPESKTFTAADGRRFAFPVGAAFLVLSALSFWRDHRGMATLLVTLGGALWLSGLLFPGRLGPVRRTWMAAAGAISKVTTPVVLSVIWFGVVTPFAWVARRFGHHPLRHPDGVHTYWTNRAVGSRTSDLRRQF
jgi:hypothetical protein